MTSIKKETKPQVETKETEKSHVTVTDAHAKIIATISEKEKFTVKELPSILDQFLNASKAQVTLEKQSKHQRAVVTLRLFNACMINLQKSKKPTLLGKLIANSEFTSLIRTMLPSIILNIKIEKGKGMDTPTITFTDGNQALFVSEAMDNLNEFTKNRDDNGNYYRIDSADVKDAFGIPMSKKEKVAKAHEKLLALTKLKVDGDLVTDILDKKVADAIDHLITVITTLQNDGVKEGNLEK